MYQESNGHDKAKWKWRKLKPNLQNGVCLESLKHRTSWKGWRRGSQERWIRRGNPRRQKRKWTHDFSSASFQRHCYLWLPRQVAPVSPLLKLRVAGSRIESSRSQAGVGCWKIRLQTRRISCHHIVHLYEHFPNGSLFSRLCISWASLAQQFGPGFTWIWASSPFLKI